LTSTLPDKPRAGHGQVSIVPSNHAGREGKRKEEGRQKGKEIDRRKNAEVKHIGFRSGKMQRQGDRQAKNLMAGKQK